MRNNIIAAHLCMMLLFQRRKTSTVAYQMYAYFNSASRVRILRAKQMFCAAHQRACTALLRLLPRAPLVWIDQDGMGGMRQPLPLARRINTHCAHLKHRMPIKARALTTHAATPPARTCGNGICAIAYVALRTAYSRAARKRI